MPSLRFLLAIARRNGKTERALVEVTEKGEALVEMTKKGRALFEMTK